MIPEVILYIPSEILTTWPFLIHFSYLSPSLLCFTLFKISFEISSFSSLQKPSYLKYVHVCVCVHVHVHEGILPHPCSLINSLREPVYATSWLGDQAVTEVCSNDTFCLIYLPRWILKDNMSQESKCGTVFIVIFFVLFCCCFRDSG